MQCPACRSDAPDSAAFCSVCGSALGDTAVTTAGGDATRPVATPIPTAGGGWLSASDAISHGRFEPGAVLDGRYRIIGLLGKGGMGEVYRADDLRLGQPIALKVLPAELRRDPQRLAQFHNEVRTARQVSHPNICRVYDIGETQGLLYLSMEYVDGEDLANSLRRIGRFPEDRALEIARQLCAAVAAAHQRGVVHRDLKPANVMLDGAGRVRVMDFGLAAIGEVANVREGTPAYMAPEQLLGRAVTAKSDLFALGLILYELFTGRRAFTASTIAELTRQHELKAVPAPSALITTLDPAIDRAILRCLEPDPERRPSSAVTVAGSLPGGDPLAAALAAGETPSPEMVAAAGEGVGFSLRSAAIVLAVTVVGIGVSLLIGLRQSPLETMRPAFGPEVLAQKARDAIVRIGYGDRAADQAYSYEWRGGFIRHVRREDKPAPQWATVLRQRPSPLEFTYRRSPEPMTAVAFHSDLLIPGVVRPDDPPPITAGMIRVDLDHAGRLVFLEAVPPQREQTPTRPAAVDWNPLFELAGLNADSLQATDPLWNWLSAADTRAAWTGTWPESGRPLRVEAAALGGRPVAFMVAGPWTEPWREAVDDSGGFELNLVVLFALAFGILAGAAALARRNLRDGRGDRHGAVRLAIAMSTLLVGLWVCTVHVSVSIGLLSMFLVAIGTATFYGVLLWTIYLAFEPFVRRYWPHVLVSWTNLLSGRFRDPVVGRDLLVGSALGVGWALLIRGIALAKGGGEYADFPGAVELLGGLRSTLGSTLEIVPYALRNTLLYFFLLFVTKTIVRRDWLIVLAFSGVLALLTDIGGSPTWWLDMLMAFVLFSTGAAVVIRWGLLSYAVGTLVSQLLLNVPVTVDASAWYFGNAMFTIAVVMAIPLWGLYSSKGRLRN